VLIPCKLEFKGHGSIGVLSSSGGPFSGCTTLVFICRTAEDMDAMTQVALHASQHYTNLTSVGLHCYPANTAATLRVRWVEHCAAAWMGKQ
jgi:hypothetical protein